MTFAKPPKKSETIEVRLSHDAKVAFMEQCRREQRTASDVIRLFIDDRLAPQPVSRRTRLPHWSIVAAGVAGALFGMGAAAPSLARAAHDNCTAFDRLDRNHDGIVSRQEFSAR